MPIQLKWLILLGALVLTCLIPLFLILWMLRSGKITTLMMEERTERYMPLLISCMSLITFYFFIKKFEHLQGIGLVLIFVICSFISVLTAMFITRFWKISLHAIGVGGLLAFTTVLWWFFDAIDINLLVLTFLVAGITGTARLYLGVHTKYQVWMGYLVGILPQALVVWWLFKF
jgi:membrane-associated phospholipid phosphatase